MLGSNLIQEWSEEVKKRWQYGACATLGSYSMHPYVAIVNELLLF